MGHEINQPENRGYADNGIPEFKEAVARFMAHSLGVHLDPATEINHSIGSKPALAMLPAAFIDPGDITLMTVPGYPVAGTHTKYLGGSVYTLPLLDGKQIYARSWIPFPEIFSERQSYSFSTTRTAPLERLQLESFYEQVVEFCQKNAIVVVQDAAHIMLSFDSEPLSFLSVEGAKDVGVEVHSLSKGFDMIGWRMGWVCGNERIVNAFADIKDNTDSGQYIAIQKAAIAALDDDDIPRAVRSKYQRRLKKLVEMLNRCGLPAKMPGGTYFLYIPSPKGVVWGSAV